MGLANKEAGHAYVPVGNAISLILVLLSDWWCIIHSNENIVNIKFAINGDSLFKVTVVHNYLPTRGRAAAYSYHILLMPHK